MSVIEPIAFLLLSWAPVHPTGHLGLPGEGFPGSDPQWHDAIHQGCLAGAWSV